MSFRITEEEVRNFRERGYHVIRRVIPASLLQDLRREARKARELAYRIHGPQAQRLSPLDAHPGGYDLAPFRPEERIIEYVLRG